MQDILGQVLKDFWEGNYTEDPLTETNISELDTLPLPYLFRDFEQMPLLEQTALKHCKGIVLDIGCGAGSHSLWLQEKGINVTGIDTSQGAIAVCKLRGLKHAIHCSLLNFRDAQYDTLLLLMNGTGIFGRLAQVPAYLEHLKGLLAPNGQILIDSSDLQYMYDQNEDGSIWVPADRYHGELDFTLHYKGQKSEVFPWLYLDANLFKSLAETAGWHFEILAKGAHYDYLARLTLRSHS